MKEWKINQRNVIDNAASNYHSVFDAFYEYLKNIEEQKADKIFIDFDYDKRIISVAGNGESINAVELNRICESGFESAKDSKHWGAGLFAFTLFSARLVFISLNEGKFYILSCAADNNQYVSDTGAAREMTTTELATYNVACGRLRHLQGGTAYVLESVCKTNSAKIIMNESMSGLFAGDEFKDWLRDKISFKLKQVNYQLKIGDGKSERIEAKLGKGKRLQFTLPSASCDCKNEFEQDGNTYRLVVDFDLWISSSNSGVVKIAEDGQNTADMNSACSGNKISKDSIFRSNNLTKYLIGYINFKIKSLSTKDPLNVYTGSRSQILLQNNFGNCLANILTKADIDIVRPEVLKYESEQTTKRDSKREETIGKLLASFFQKNAESLDWLATEGLGITETKRVCPNCNAELPIFKISHYNGATTLKTFIIYDMQKSQYICGKCGCIWNKENRAKNSKSSSNSNKDKDKDTGKGGSGGKKGFNVKTSIRPFNKSDTREVNFIYNPVTVEINSIHHNYKEIQASKDAKFRYFHECKLVLLSYVQNKIAGNTNISTPDLLKKLNEATSLMEVAIIKRGN